MRRKDLKLVALPPLPPLEDEAALDPIRLPAALPEPEPAARRSAPQSEAMASMTRVARQETDIRATAMWERTAAIAALVAETDARLRKLAEGAVYPLDAYDRFEGV